MMYQPHKILVIASQIPAGDQDPEGRWLEKFYDRLSSHGHDITILAPTAGASRSENRNGVRIEWFSCYFASTLVALRELSSDSRSRMSFNFFLLPYLVMCCIATLRFARDSTFDVIHVHSFLPEGLIGMFARSVNGASLIYLAHEDEVAAGSTGLMNRYFQFFVRSANMLIANNGELRDTMKSRTLRRWNVLEYEAETCGKSDDGGHTRIPRVLLVVEPTEKVVSTLMHAILKINQQHRVKFYVAGLGSYRVDFEEWRGGFGSGQCIEFLQDATLFARNNTFAKCDLCVVVGSTTELQDESVLRKSVLEAYRHRKPVVATEFNRIREVVIENVTGFLVPQDDSIALADAINNLLAHPYKRERFGNSGYELREETSAWDLIMSELEDLHCIASGLPFRIQPIAHSKKKHTYAQALSR